jgi:hypothetical protein
VRFCVNLCLLLDNNIYFLLDNNICLLLDNNLCLLLDNNIYLLLDNNICLLLDNNISLRLDYVFCWTLPPMNIFYLIRILCSSTLYFYLVNRMLITCESSIGVLPLILYHAYHYLLHLLSTNHKYT